MTALLIALGFAAGSIPFGVLVSRRRGVDIREHGSGNIGATNVTRVLGKGAGAIVLVLDAAKGALPTLAARNLTDEPWGVVATGFAAIIGHCFSPFLRGRGGKGVATALGVFLALDPLFALGGMVVWGLVFAITRVPALGSLAAAFAIGTAFVVVRDAPPTTVLSAATCALLVFTHRGNLMRLTKSRRSAPPPG